MYAITAITGQVGSALADQLLARGQNVRAIVRDAAKGRVWADKGCEIAIADMDDTAALTTAFTGVEGVFILLPPNFDPSADFRESRALIGNICAALQAARPKHVLCLSTIGAQATQPNLLNQLGILEYALGGLDLPVTFLRAAWFMENALWDIAPARDTGVIPSFLQPLDRPIPMIATADIGKTGADILIKGAPAHSPAIVELQASRPVSPNDIAAAFGKLLGKTVTMEIVARDKWEDLFRAQGMNNPQPRMQMLDGFNQGWIAFADGRNSRNASGDTELETVLAGLLARHPA